VVFHHPVYPSHPWRDTPALREYWVPIFDKRHVDFVLQGHDHAYLRTYPLRAHHRASCPGQGTIYLIAVSGDKFVDQAHRDYIEVGRSGVSTYQIFDLDAQSNRLTYRALTENGRIIDELRIDKPRAPASPTDRPDCTLRAPHAGALTTSPAICRARESSPAPAGLSPLPP
jgi:acid phosphatase type 7